MKMINLLEFRGRVCVFPVTMPGSHVATSLPAKLEKNTQVVTKISFSEDFFHRVDTLFQGVE